MVSRGMSDAIAIRPAREDAFDAVTRVWMASWESTGLGAPGDASFDDLRARIPREIANGWSLYVAEADGDIAAMLAFRRADDHLDQLFVAPAHQGKGIGKALLAFAREAMPQTMWLRTAADNARAIAWYEREGFVREKLETHPTSGRMMAYYRWSAAAPCAVCGEPLVAAAPRWDCRACGASARRRAFFALFHEGAFTPRRDGATALCMSEEGGNQALLARHYAITSASLFGSYGAGTIEGVDIQTLAPFAGGAFDLVTAIGVLDYVADAASAFASAARVLRPGGLFVLHVLPHLLREGDAAPVVASTKFSTDTWLSYIPRDVPVSTYRYGVGWIEQTLKEAGLKVETITRADPAGPQTWFLARR